ncbi:RNA exonuclease 1 [Biomphalaria pfeifferi]|uniref:RNA exonuclease 1 n=1 Tax=Biomphalaria pfeifferi TaxID=112525 RepID=A0AAD8BAD1_BIOPF|nr:RNA exonuclease 1 [Biomphalaria pfeifferi]
MDTSSVSARKLRRLESKKKKAAAFLQLIGQLPVPNSTPAQKMDQVRGDGESQNALQTEDVLTEMRNAMRERQKKSMQKPKVFLTLENTVAFRPLPEEPINKDELPPLYVMDLQQLLLNGIQGNMASYKPRWCKILRVGKVSSVILILVEGLSYSDYIENKHFFPYITETFPDYVEMISPAQYSQTIDSELYNVPLSVSQLKKVNVRVPKSIRAVVSSKIATLESKPGEKLSRKCLLLSTYQMMLEGYPLPIHTNDGKYKNFVFSKQTYKQVTDASPLFALDCEMCLTSIHKNELTRVSVVAEDGILLYDTLVKPRNKIINYLTRFSGITKEMLESVTTRIEDVQKKLQEILPADAILCGQSLNSDLVALKMFHPYVIDTSVIFNLSGNRNVKASLRKLSSFFLNRNIQGSKDGHCSTEDALATLDLVKLKLSKGLEFGDATLNGIYFPDIQTYFMEEVDNSCKALTENVEKEIPEKKNNSVVIHDKGDDNGIMTEKRLSNVVSEQIDKSVDIPSRVSVKRDLDGNDKNTNNIDNVKTLTGGDSRNTASSCSSDSSCEESEKEECNEPPSSKKARTCEPNQALSVSNDSVQELSREKLDILIEECVGDMYQSTTKKVKIQQSCLFSQQNSVHVQHSFFKLVYDSGRSACLIDRAATTEQYARDPIEKLTVSTDTEARRCAKSMVQSKEFIWARFHSYAEENNSDCNKQKLMKKIDNRVRSVMKHAKPNALVTVVFTGRENYQNTPHNMATFVSST